MSTEPNANDLCDVIATALARVRNMIAEGAIESTRREVMLIIAASKRLLTVLYR